MSFSLFNIIVSVAALASIVAFVFDLKRSLMMLQQNSYRNERYFRWLNESGDSTSYPRIFAMLIALSGMVYFFPADYTVIAAIIFSIYLIIKLSRQKYKKPLVFTKRAIRIYSVSVVIALAVLAASYIYESGIFFGAKSKGLFGVTVASQFLIAASFAVTTIANFILSPVEKLINRHYYNDAKRRLDAMPDLKIIGITGSYGKTSTKHYLYRILSEQYDTLITPGSYNTTLGVVRTIREQLQPYNEVFIAEMGAKQPGDIREICDLVHPSIGIITAVGEQHLETFKTIERVQSTKFELIDALPAGGLAVVNNDFEYSANRLVKNVTCLHYAVSHTDNADFIATDIKYDASGTSFVIKGKNFEMPLHTRLVGECNVSNLIAAVIVAKHLGVTDEKIRVAVEHIQQVEHRLNMKRTPNGITIIDDAFNSNPTGSKMAVDVLASMTSGKRIIITPGMIELGDQQFERNRELGEHIARNVDVAIIVGEYNHDAITEGINSVVNKTEGFKCIEVDSFVEAQKQLAQIARPGDTVLYENDLPDTFK